MVVSPSGTDMPLAISASWSRTVAARSVHPEVSSPPWSWHERHLLLQREAMEQTCRSHDQPPISETSALRLAPNSALSVPFCWISSIGCGQIPTQGRDPDPDPRIPPRWSGSPDRETPAGGISAASICTPSAMFHHTADRQRHIDRGIDAHLRLLARQKDMTVKNGPRRINDGSFGSSPSARTCRSGDSSFTGSTASGAFDQARIIDTTDGG